jgi:hypothetical protein
MNGAQRAAFSELLMVGQQMSNVCFNWSQSTLAQIDEQRWEFMRDTMRGLQKRYDEARNRYFELEAEAAKAKSSARKSRGAVRQKAGANQPKNSNV